MTRNERQWIKEYENKDALWIHDGNPKRPHALLSSGLHSNGFFNSRRIIPQPNENDYSKIILLNDAAWDLLGLFKSVGGDLKEVDGVVGPQTGATKLAEFIRNQANEFLGGGVSFYASPAKHTEDGVKSMVFDAEELAPLRGKKVLLCEDVLTTGGSVKLTVDAILKAGGTPLPFVLCLVNRSGLKEVFDKQIIALIHRSMSQWVAPCKYCQKGSEAIMPKDPENWKLLNAEY